MNKLEKEIWKPIKGYEGYYEVSNMGSVRSLDRTIKPDHTTPYKLKGRVLSSGDNNTGYLFVYLYREGNRTRKYVHQLVAQHFVYKPKSHLHVNHINHIRSDNRSSNLEWTTTRNNVSLGWERRPTTSKYRGVSWHKGNNRWVAQAHFKGEGLHIGYFKDEESAHKAYKEFLNLNNIVL